MEGLEQRQLLAGNLYISEFMASNGDTIADEDGDNPDWIEIANPLATPINLDGYYLTDNANNLTKWRLPAVTVEAGGYVVVFASGKDRAVADAPLHTNFSLDASGEYLGLVAPDGGTILSQYAPVYPMQLRDISYGISSIVEATPLIGPAAPAKTHIPTGPMDGSWLHVGFNDSAWISGTTGIGFDFDNTQVVKSGFTVRMVDVNNSIDNIAAARNALNGVGNWSVLLDTTVDDLAINYGMGGDFGNDMAWPNGMMALDTFAIRATANVFIPAGTWTFNVKSDDGFMLTVPGVSFTNRINENYNSTGWTAATVPANTLVYGAPRGAAHTSASFTVPAGGLQTTLTLEFYENFGGDLLEFSVGTGSQAFGGSFVLAGDGALPGWQIKTTSTTPPPDYNPLIGTGVASQMLDKNASALIRIPIATEVFPEDFDMLRLNVKYDDGFVAYLNGVEIARRNAPATLSWNSTATVNRADTDAIVYEQIDIHLPAGLLQPGANTNILAIHGLNVSAGDLDFLIYAELQGLRVIDSSETYFLEPTPGAANKISSMTEVVGNIQFSQERGFYSGPFVVTLATPTQDAVIRYTLDGSTPTATTGQVYTGPISITGTSTLRAGAFKPGALSSRVDTQTYIFVADVIHQSPDGSPPPGWPATWSPNVTDYGMDPDVVNHPSYAGLIQDALLAIPTFSIVTDLPNLFGTTGIYSNPGWRGRTAERPASVELIYPDGTEGFQINAGLRIRGGFSRSLDNPKHAFRLHFRGEYGDTKLDHPFMGEGVSTFDGFDLRTFQNYSWSFQNDSRGIFVRDQFSRDLQLALGQPGSRGNYYHLYVNGQYFGIFNTDERPEASYAANQFGGKPEDYDVIKTSPSTGYAIYATDGNMAAWTDLWTQAIGGMGNHANYMRIQGLNPDGTRNPAYPVLLDVDNLIDYMLVIFYGGNLDAPLSNFLGNSRPNNFFAIRNRETNDKGFIFVVHDAEHTLLNVNEDRTGPYNTFDSTNASASLQYSNPQFLFQLLSANPEFRLRVADRTHRAFFNDGPMKYENALALFNKRIDELYLAVIAESARWGDSKRATPFTRDVEWINEVNRIRNQYFPFRTNIVLNQLIADNLYPTLRAPVFSQFGGVIPATYNLTITRPDNVGILYYTLDGSDPRLMGGAVNPEALTYTGPVPITGAVTVTARIYNPATDTWTAMTLAPFRHNLGPLRITEIMYNPLPDAGQTSTVAQGYEFIELQNTGAAALDISGAAFTRGIGFVFPAGSVLAGGQRIVLVRDPLMFAQRYPGVSIFGTYTGSLDNSGERLTLSDVDDNPLLDFSYNDAWYPITDGEGFSLVAINPLASPAAYGAKANWRPSNNVGGGPAAPDPGLNPGSVVVNEVMTNTKQAIGDWIELHNTTAHDIDIGYWFLSDDPLDPTRYQIAPGTIIPAGGFIVFTELHHFGNPADPGARRPFALAAIGEEVILRSFDTLDTPGGYIDYIDFAAAAPEVTFGRHVKSTGGKDIVAMSAPTMGYANALPAVGPVVISEIMYNPAGDGDEFLELYNLTASTYRFYDPQDPQAKWAFIDGVRYTFKQGEEIGPLGYALVVGIDPELFRAKYGIPADVPIFGPWEGALDNAGESVKFGVFAGLTPSGNERYITIDQVNYNNSGNWPSSPNGTGPSLTRIVFSDYGNDAGNWAASPIGGTPGTNFTPPAAPSQLTGTGIGGPRIQLAWTDNSNTEDGFQIERSSNGTTYTLVGVVGPDTTTFEDMIGLQAGVFYTYRVRAFNAMGTSTWSNLINVAAPQVQTVNLVQYNSVWRYNQARVDLPANWMTPGYDDTSADWSSGPGLLYVESFWNTNPPPAPLGTQLTLGATTYYFRTQFTLNAEPADVGSLRLWVIVDDGAVVYLNGQQVFTIGMPAGPYTYSTFANRVVDNAVIEGPFIIPAAYLVKGVNTLAVEVHQVNAGSSDVAWGARLEAVVTPTTVSASIPQILPNPAEPLNSVTISFSDPVAGFDLADLRLTRGGGANLLTGAETLTSSDGGKTWVLGNLAPLTAISGRYTLTLNANGSGIAATGFPGRILGSDAYAEFRVTSTFLNGTAGDDTFYLRRVLDNVEVFPGTPNGQAPLHIIPAADLLSLTINGGAGDDTVWIMSPLPVVPVFNGGVGRDRMVFGAGLHVFAQDLSASGIEELIVAGSATVRFESSQRLDLLEIKDAASVSAVMDGGLLLHVNELHITGAGSLDLADNLLAMPATEANREQLAQALAALIRSGRGSGNWNGPGLTSSKAALDEQELTTLAVVRSEHVPGGLPEAGGEGMLVVRYALAGDVDLDHAIGSADYFRIDLGYLLGLSGYANGDFDHSGVIDGDDFFIIDRAFLMQGQFQAALSASAVPIPSTPADPLDPPQPAGTMQDATGDDAEVLFGAAIPMDPAMRNPFLDQQPIEDDDAVWATAEDVLA